MKEKEGDVHWFMTAQLLTSQFCVSAKRNISSVRISQDLVFQTATTHLLTEFLWEETPLFIRSVISSEYLTNS